MSVTLKGSSPATLTTGILLLSRARSFGLRLDVEILGDAREITPVEGPALVHSPVLASCGVGRDLGVGALVVVSGPPSEPIATSLSADGADGWFHVDRSGDGLHPATRAFVQLSCDDRLPLREQGRQLRQALGRLGMPSEPAVMDLLFAAPAAPLVRLALALRAGRAMSPGHPNPITRYIGGRGDLDQEPLPSPCSAEALALARQDGRIDRMMANLALSVRDRVEAWFDAIWEAGTTDRPAYLALLCGLGEIGAQVLTLPPHGMLTPLSPEMDAVAVGLGPALGAVRGEVDASRVLVDTFRFLGGRFTDTARYPMALDDDPAPSSRLERWQWFCRSTRRAADQVDEIWRRIVDPVQ